MFRLAYQVQAEIDNEIFTSNFIKSSEAIRFLKDLVQSLTEAGCKVSGKIEKTLIEITSLED